MNFKSKLQHPTPQRIRKNWQLLNGIWDFEFDKNNVGKKERWYVNKKFSKQINVPFVYQSKLSGIDSSEYISVVWYKRAFKTTIQDNKRYLLHFQASDYQTSVYIDGHFIGINEGGFFDFTFDITNYISSNYEITVRVEDKNETYQHLGKQSYKDDNFLCWYSKSVGIWQDVWIEEVGDNFIKDFKLTPNLKQSTIDIEAVILTDGDFKLKTRVLYENKLVCETISSSNSRRYLQQNYLSSRFADFRIHYWSPSNPQLYDIELELIDNNGKIVDHVVSYFGMRKISTNDGYVQINNQKLFHKMILDQGYFGDGLMTPRDTQDLVNDIKYIKEIGFNSVRKHQKVEDMRYLFLCDYYGLLMWAEMPSFYEYSSRSKSEMIKQIDRFISRHYNSPSVEAYVLFNESWGLNRIMDDEQIQYFVNSMYSLTKSIDNSRIIIGNDGWEHTMTDILTIHDYNSDENSISKIYKDKEKVVSGSPSATSNRSIYVTNYNYNNEPIFISEYGGIAFEKCSENNENWGYGERIKDKNEVLKKIEKLTKAFINNNYISGICYTQLSDVEQEVNGLLDRNHKQKFDIELVKKTFSIISEGGFIFD